MTANSGSRARGKRGDELPALCKPSRWGEGRGGAGRGWHKVGVQGEEAARMGLCRRVGTRGIGNEESRSGPASQAVGAHGGSALSKSGILSLQIMPIVCESPFPVGASP